MRIRLTKVSDEQHRLEIERDDGSREAIDLVTREALFHDLLHYAVESAMATQGGFWGALAAGKTMADLNDRSGESMREFAVTLLPVEEAVGMMTGVVRSEDPDALAAATIRRYHESMERPVPAWCSESFVSEVREQMRQLVGRWRAAPYRHSMEIEWPQNAEEKAR